MRDETGASVPRVVLAVLAVLLAAGCLAVLAARTVTPDWLPDSWAAPRDTEDREEAVSLAARNAARAFLDVDYRDMGPRIDTMLAMSTGDFKDEYAGQRDALEKAATAGWTISRGTVRNVGIAESDADSAEVFVAADSTIENKAIAEAQAKGQPVDDQRAYRLRISLTKVGDDWLVEDLDFVS